MTGYSWGISSGRRLFVNVCTGAPYMFRTRHEARLVAGAKAVQNSWAWGRTNVVKIEWTAKRIGKQVDSAPAR